MSIAVAETATSTFLCYRLEIALEEFRRYGGTPDGMYDRTTPVRSGWWEEHAWFYTGLRIAHFGVDNNFFLQSDCA